jgi:hypothetical protein
LLIWQNAKLPGDPSPKAVDLVKEMMSLGQRMNELCAKGLTPAAEASKVISRLAEVEALLMLVMKTERALSIRHRNSVE